MIDLRSDAVTLPGRKIREAMAPAEILGKEAAIFMPSGTGATPSTQLREKFRQKAVLVPPAGHHTVRAVTHLGIPSEPVTENILAFNEVLK